MMALNTVHEDRIQNFNDLYKNHEASRNQVYSGYNSRFPVTDNMVKWSIKAKDYSPNFAFDKDAGIEPPASFAQTFESQYLTIDNGFPQNPVGRTGLKGRGKLYYFGPNHAADVLGIRQSDKGYEVLVIKRGDGSWALPGGFLDKHEATDQAAFREFTEEALCGVSFKLEQLSNQPLKLVYQGYADDPRNTDNAWIETSAYILFLKDGINKEIFRAGDDAHGIKWISIYSPEAKNLYGSHSAILEVAVRSQIK